MVVGEQTIYLSHLPMFMFDPERQEHNFQVILEVELTAPSNAHGIYANDRREHPDVRMYTMSPAPFEMVELDPRRPTRQSLVGSIYRGHLERGGKAIIGAQDPDPKHPEPSPPAATARVASVIYFHKFEENAEPLAQLGYLLFGKVPEVFLVHIITRPPDFDQILTVTLSGQSLPADALERGIRITIPDRPNTAQARIKAHEQVLGRVQTAGAVAGQPVELEAGIELYFEEGELGDPNPEKGQPGAMTFKQTPEEKAAGF